MRVPVHEGVVDESSTPSRAVHRPALPETLQETHWPPQVDSQQTPSTQNPDAHSAAPAHDCPRSFRVGGGSFSRLSRASASSAPASTRAASSGTSFVRQPTTTTGNNNESNGQSLGLSMHASFLCAW